MIEVYENCRNYFCIRQKNVDRKQYEKKCFSTAATTQRVDVASSRDDKRKCEVIQKLYINLDKTEMTNFDK